MRFTVTWTDEADAQLANTWLDLELFHRPHFTRCIDEIEAGLRENAHLKGVKLQGFEPLRTYFAEPRRGEGSVGVFFVVFEMDRLVQIHGLKILPARDVTTQ